MSDACVMINKDLAITEANDSAKNHPELNIKGNGQKLDAIFKLSKPSVNEHLNKYVYTEDGAAADCVAIDSKRFYKLYFYKHSKNFRLVIIKPDKAKASDTLTADDSDTITLRVRNLSALIKRDGTILSVNEGFRMLFGLKESVAGENFFEFISNDDNAEKVETLKNELRKRNHINTELAVANVKNEKRWVEWTFSTTKRNRDNTFRVTGKDIHESRVVQEALSKSEQRFMDIAKVEGQFIWEADNNMNFVYLSPGIEEITGFTVDELIGKKVTDFFQNGDAEFLGDRINLSDNSENSFSGLKHRILHKKGHTVWLSTSGRGLPENGENGTGLRGVSIDITKETLALESLYRSEQNYGLLFRQAPVGIFNYDLNMVIIDCNDAFVNIIGFKRQDLMGLDLRRLNDKRILPAIMAAVSDEKCEYTGEYLTTNTSKTIYISLKCVPFYDDEQNVIGGIGMVQDISKSYKAESALKYQVELELLALDISTRFINLDTEQTSASINNGLERIGQFSNADRSYMFVYNPSTSSFHYTHEWCADGIESKQDSFESIPKDMLPLLSQSIQDKKPVMISDIDSAAGLTDMERDILRNHDTSSVLMLPIFLGNQLHSVLGLDACGERRKWKYSEIIVFQQVGNSFAYAMYRRESEEKIRQNEERFRSLVHNATDLITIFDKQGIIKYNSPSFHRIMGYSLDNADQYTMRELIHPSDLMHVLRGFLSAAKSEDDVERIEFRMKRSDGSYAYFESLISNMYNNPSINGIVINSRDITERKQAEAEIQGKQNFILTISKTIPGLVYVFNVIENRLIYTNKDEESRLNFYHKPIFALETDTQTPVHPDDLQEAKKFQKLIRQRKKLNNTLFEYRVRSADSKYRWLEERISIFSKTDDGQPAEILGLVQDITSQKESELVEKVIYTISESANKAQNVKDLYKSIYESLCTLFEVDNFYIALIDEEEENLKFPYYVDMGGHAKSESRPVGNGLTEHIMYGGKAVVMSAKDFDCVETEGVTIMGKTPRSLLGIPLIAGGKAFGALVVHSYRDEVVYDENQRKLLTFVGEQVALTIQRKQTEELLEREKTFANALINALPGIYYLFDENGNMMRWNDNFSEITGYSDEEIKEMAPLDFIEEASRVKIETAISMAFNKGMVEVEAKIKAKDGEITPFLFSGIRIKVNNRNCISGAGIDITERLKAEEQIKSSLKEKKILLSEVHHRVKNNLAVITGLLSLQADLMDTPQTRQILRESELRIKSMAMIHEKLYQTDIYSSVEFQSYMLDLSDSINSMFDNSGRVKIRLDMDNLYLSLNKAIPCGLIINELLTNSFKHAFKGIKKPVIKIDMKKKNDDVKLTYSDNGVGLPEDFDISSTSSLGMSLIEGLSGQLGGEFTFKSSGGTTFTLNFEDSE